jgi:cystathionine beta-synthase
MYNDYWMADQGFLERPRYGDLRDVISRPYAAKAVVTLSPDDTLLTALGRFKLYDVSQLPVVRDDRIVGIVDESDVLLAVYGHEKRFREPVSRYMTTRLQTLSPAAPIQALLDIFEAGRVPIVCEGERFLGLITRIDLLNYLRRRMPN